MLRSTKSMKTMATAAGTFVICFNNDDPQRPDNPESWLRHAIDSIAVLRRRGDVKMATTDTRTEVRCDVEYGPVFGAYRSDLQKRLNQIAGQFESAVFDYRRNELRSHEQITAMIARLDTDANNIDRPIVVRERASQDAMRLRELLAARTGTSTTTTTPAVTTVPAPTETYKPEPLTEAEKVED